MSLADCHIKHYFFSDIYVYILGPFGFPEFAKKCVTFLKKKYEAGYRGWHQKRYSVMAIMLRYSLELSHNSSTLGRKVITGLIEIVIASYSYRSSLVGIDIASYSYCSKATKSLSFPTTTSDFHPLGWI